MGGEPHLRATGCHLPYGITQCYLPPDTSERAPPLTHSLTPMDRPPCGYTGSVCVGMPAVSGRVYTARHGTARHGKLTLIRH